MRRERGRYDRGPACDSTWFVPGMDAIEAAVDLVYRNGILAGALGYSFVYGHSRGCGVCPTTATEPARRQAWQRGAPEADRDHHRKRRLGTRLLYDGPRSRFFDVARLSPIFHITCSGDSLCENELQATVGVWPIQTHSKEIRGNTQSSTQFFFFFSDLLGSAFPSNEFESAKSIENKPPCDIWKDVCDKALMADRLPLTAEAARTSLAGMNVAR